MPLGLETTHCCDQILGFWISVAVFSFLSHYRAGGSLDEQSGSKQKSHWQYAAGQAFRALEQQIREFNFEKYADGHTYCGFEPEYYLGVMDGFLNEGDDIVPVGNKQKLTVLRQMLIHHLLPAYNIGIHTANEIWQADTNLRDEISTPQLHQLASARSPFGGRKREWFVEGFCRAWADREFDSHRES